MFVTSAENNRKQLLCNYKQNRVIKRLEKEENKKEAKTFGDATVHDSRRNLNNSKMVITKTKQERKNIKCSV